MALIQTLVFLFISFFASSYGKDHFHSWGSECFTFLFLYLLGQDCLSEHNKYRARHGSPPVFYDRTLEQFAMQRAEYMASTDIFAHPRSLPFGENLYWRSGRQASCQAALSAWYKEDKWYNYERGSFSPSTGHFTQMIWKATRYVGCASAKSSRTGRMYIAVSQRKKFFSVPKLIFIPRH